MRHAVIKKTGKKVMVYYKPKEKRWHAYVGWAIYKPSELVF